MTPLTPKAAPADLPEGIGDGWIVYLDQEAKSTALACAKGHHQTDLALGRVPWRPLVPQWHRHQQSKIAWLSRCLTAGLVLELVSRDRRNLLVVRSVVRPAKGVA